MRCLEIKREKKRLKEIVKLLAQYLAHSTYSVNLGLLPSVLSEVCIV